MRQEQYGVAVVRMQGAELHPGWKAFIEYIQARHERVVLILGVAPFPTPRNPLSAEMRKAMIVEEYPSIEVLTISNHRSNEAWSRSLDALLDEQCAGNARLYGSRDSFIPFYSGRYPTELVPEFGAHNGTEYRTRIIAEPEHNQSFRRGVIYAWQTRLAVTRPMVDIAIIKPETDEILLGKKKDDEEKWRFFGGLVDPTDTTLELAAKREALEEAGDIEIDDIRYVASSQVGDWRYKGTGEYGMTTLFRATFVFGAPRAGDDVDGVDWFSLSQLPHILVEEHVHLGILLLKHNGEKQ